MTSALLESHRDRIGSLCRTHKVLRLDAIGSVLTDEFHGHSDIDFLVSFQRGEEINAFRQYFDFKEALEDLLGRNVDLVCANAIRNRYFLAEVKSNRQLLYAA